MIINLLKYDGQHGDGDNKIFGPYKYACGETLPGDYFDGDDMRKEVTFIGLYFNKDPDEQDKKKKKRQNNLQLGRIPNY